MKGFFTLKEMKLNSELHNTRAIKPSYLLPEGEHYSLYRDEKLTEKFSFDKVSDLDYELELIKKIVKEKTGRKMQKKAKPLREGVIRLSGDLNRDFWGLDKFIKSMEKKWGVKCLQFHIHYDEGHKDKNTGEPKYNYHAHLVFGWIDYKTGKSPRMSKEEMSLMQTIACQSMGMERGQKGSKAMHLNHYDYRRMREMINELSEQFSRKLTNEEERTVREKVYNEVVQHKEEQISFVRNSPMYDKSKYVSDKEKEKEKVKEQPKRHIDIEDDEPTTRRRKRGRGR